MNSEFLEGFEKTSGVFKKIILKGRETLGKVQMAVPGLSKVNKREAKAIGGFLRDGIRKGKGTTVKGVFNAPQ